MTASLTAAVLLLGGCASHRVAFQNVSSDCEQSQGQRASLRVRVHDEDGGVMPGVPIVVVVADGEWEDVPLSESTATDQTGVGVVEVPGQRHYLVSVGYVRLSRRLLRIEM
jgi:hypothetical protein